MNSWVLDDEKQRVIALQTAIVRREGFFLAGETGLGVRLGHRTSRDIDWVTPRSFDINRLTATLAALPEKPQATQRLDQHGLRAYYGPLETNFIRCPQASARPELITVAGLNIPVADMETLALMKATALHDRGTRRDVVDIHAICKSPGWSVARLMDLATTRLPFHAAGLKVALTHFLDADKQVEGASYGTPWSRVKSELTRDVLAWERGRSRGLDR